MSQPTTQEPVVIRDPNIKQPKVTPPALVQVIQAFASVFKRHGRKKNRSLQHMIEHRLETPVFIIVTFTMVIRAAQLFSGGRLVMSQLLGDKYAAFEIVTGVGLGLGSEMLMTIAGRSWKSWDADVTETEARPGMSKAARQAYINRAKKNTRYSQIVMFIGMGASLFAGLAFLFTNSGKALTLATFADPNWWFTFISDLVATAVVTVCVFYLGVLKESHAMTDAEEALSELDEGMNEAVAAAIQRFRDGLQTPKDEKLIAEHLSPARKAKFLRAVAKSSVGKMWTSKELRRRLGITNDATDIRKLNRRINELAKEPDNGLEKATDGKTWMIPAAVVFDTWGEEIAAHDAALLVAQAVPAAA